MLVALEEEGIVARDEQGKFVLGPGLIALGGVAARDINLRDVAKPALMKLSERVGEAVTLEVPLLSGPGGPPQMLVLDEINGPHILGVRAFIGRSLPIHATSTGKAVMAYLSPPELERILARPLERFTNHTLTTADEIQAALRTARSDGFAIVQAEFEDGLVAIAAPILGSDRVPKGAISAHWPIFRFDQARLEEFGADVHAAARSISERLGFEQS
jgi:IclR family acetate operon transcriptional repressor